MAPSPPSSQPLVLIWGEDEFTVKERSRQLFQEWGADGESFDREIIEASAANSSEALRAQAQLRQALQTLPFFGGTKLVWFKNCNFLGDDRTGSARAVSENLGELAEELKRLTWDDLRLLISAGKVDKRRLFYKTVSSLGSVEHHPGWSADPGTWVSAAESLVEQHVRVRGKRIAPDASAKLIARVGPNSRQLVNELEKLALFAGEREEIGRADVEAVSVRNKQSQAFALGDALGERNLPALLRVLDDELWAMKGDSQSSELRLLYGLISKVRTLLLVKELLAGGWVKAGTSYGQFKSQLSRLDLDAFPSDKRFNPLAMHPFVLYNALDQAKRYTHDELIRALEGLLECNERLIFSNLDGALVLQQTLLKIVRSTPLPEVV